MTSHGTTVHRSFSTFPVFLITVLLWCVAFGGLKFLLKNLTLVPLGEDPAVLLEKVVGYLSIGSVIAYAVGGSIASVVSKRTIIFATAVIAILALLGEYQWGLSSSVSLAATSIVLGILYGLFAITRSVLSYVEIVKTRFPDTMINGFVTVLLILGIILGAYMSARSYELIGDRTLWIFIGIFAAIGIASLFLRYEEFEEHVSFRASIIKTWQDALWITRVRSMVLFPSAALWSIATIVSVKSIPYAQAVYGIPESQSSLIVLYSAIGVIAGNLLTMRVGNRWLFFRIYTYIFAALVALFYVIAVSFPLMVAYSISLGIFMGASTNLIDSYYLQFIGKNDVKENGAALNGIILNAMMAFLLFFLQLIPESTHFLVLGGIAVAMGIYVRLKIKTLKFVEPQR